MKRFKVSKCFASYNFTPVSFTAKTISKVNPLGKNERRTSNNNRFKSPQRRRERKENQMKLN